VFVDVVTAILLVETADTELLFVITTVLLLCCWIELLDDTVADDMLLDCCSWEEPNVLLLLCTFDEEDDDILVEDANELEVVVVDELASTVEAFTTDAPLIPPLPIEFSLSACFDNALSRWGIARASAAAKAASLCISS
jgi:hypothetical protein